MNKIATNSISAIVFDFGDVMCFWDDEILSNHNLRNLFFDYLSQGGAGTYHSFRDYYDRAHPRTTIPRDIAYHAFAEWESSARIDERMIKLIIRLKEKYQIGLLSNFPKGLEEFLVDRFHIRHLFDVVVSSYDIQMRKPAIDVYHYALKQLAVRPKNCLFIDDLEKNIRAAEKVGMQTILFKEYKGFIKQLNVKLKL